MIIIVGLSAEAPATDDIPSAPLKLSTCVPGLTTRLQSLGICYVRMEYRGENCRGEFVSMEFMKVDGGGISPLDPTVHSTVSRLCSDSCSLNGIQIGLRVTVQPVISAGTSPPTRSSTRTTSGARTATSA